MSKKTIMEFLIIFLLLAAMLVFPIKIVSATQSSNWGQYHGDASHNGYSSFPCPTNPTEIWNYSLGGTNDGLIAANGILLASKPGSQSGDQVFAYNESNGASIYQVASSYPGQVIIFPRTYASYPAWGGNLVFSAVSDDSGVDQLYIDGNFQSNGQFSWYYPIPLNVANSPYYGRTMISYYQGDAYAVSFDASNITAIQSSGVLDWQLNLPGQIDTIPTIGNNIIALGYANLNQISAVASNTNSTLWNFPTDSPITATVAFNDGNFYFGSKNGTVYSISQNGALNWNTTLPARVETTPATAYGLIFEGADNGVLYALNNQTGKVMWQQSADSNQLLSSPVASSNGMVYQATISGVLDAFNATSGAKAWSLTLSGGITSSPVLDNGEIFLIDTNGVIHAIGVPPPTVSPSSWKMDVGQSNLFTAVVSGNYSSYQWYLNGLAQAGQTAKTFNYIANSTGSPSITVTATDSSGVTSAQSSVPSVTVNPSLNVSNPSATAGTINQGQQSTLSVNSVSGGTSPNNYQWLSKAPGASSYSNISSAILSTYVFSTNTTTTAGAWNFELRVIDNASSPVTITSGSVVVNVVSVTIASAPLSFQVTEGSNFAYLSWTSPANNGGAAVTSYNIYRGIVSGSESLLTSGVTGLSYTDSSVTNGLTYYYQVTAVNPAGESARSTETSVSFSSITPTPTPTQPPITPIPTTPKPSTPTPTPHIVPLTPTPTPFTPTESPTPTATPKATGTFPIDVLIIIVIIVAVVVGMASLFVHRRKSAQGKVGSTESSTSTDASAPQNPPASSPKVYEPISPQATQRLEKLKDMLDKGLITQQDFDEQKRKLLNNG